MSDQTTTLQTQKPIALTFTDKPITAWGGMALLAGYAARINLPEALDRHLSFELTSPNAIRPTDIILAFVGGVLTGARRFAHIEALRHDEVLGELLGIRRFPSDVTIMRHFTRFGQKELYERFEPLRAWQIKQMTPPGSYTQDLDSSVFERYGKQEGAVLGYNPKKHRRPSHHPLLATLEENRSVIHSWLRSGNTASVSCATEFLGEALAALPAGAVAKAIRGDSGFDSEKVFAFLEGRGLRYAISARFMRGVKKEVQAISGWRELDADVSVAETVFQAKSWSRPRRLVVIRQRDRPNDFVRGKELFDDKAYLYQGIFTDLPDAPEEVWRFYRKRAVLETRIRELKWDYGLDGFCMKKFYATEAAFRMVCFAYNLMQQFQKELGIRTKKTLGVVRTMVLACGAELGRDGHKMVLRLSLSGKRRERFRGYYDKIFHWEKPNGVAVETG
ncbi:MAG: IS1380 family transposase [Elusimicrobiales bacterium]|nr:IS1380 family transposase [Elusimicrobiales bacterium]